MKSKGPVFFRGSIDQSILSDWVLRRSESIFWGFFWIPRSEICVGWGRVGDHQPFLKHMSPSSIQSSKRRIARTNQDMKESRIACKDWSISTVSEEKKDSTLHQLRTFQEVPCRKLKALRSMAFSHFWWLNLMGCQISAPPTETRQAKPQLIHPKFVDFDLGFHFMGDYGDFTIFVLIW